MKVLPEGLGEADLLAALTEGWRLDIASFQYLAVGFGSYHWDLRDRHGRRLFITVDDLDDKTYLGQNRDSALEGLRCAFDAAYTLRHHGGLEFVVAPLPTPTGETVRRIGRRHSVAVFPFVAGIAEQFAEIATPAWSNRLLVRSAEDRAELVRMLVRLHQATQSVVTAVGPASLLPERSRFESALQELDREWTGGPFSEPARALLARHAPSVIRQLSAFDDLSARVAASGLMSVITHGEPHAGNLVRTDGGHLVLVDWDTLALAPPERDLWLVDSGAGRELSLYAELSGRRVDENAIALYRMRWALDDITIFVNGLRSTHARTPDTEKAWDGLVRSFEALDPPRG
jgi:spectinomycin phosphotransferase